MLVIRKGQQNNLTVTATEESELTNPNWLFVFTHLVRGVPVGVVLTNTSGYTTRYDLFSFTEGTDATLKYTGIYKVEVYEQASAVNTDPALASKLCHQENAKVLKQDFVNRQYNPTIIREIYEFS